jgi:dTDP-4-dehydrorhamnose reductase
MRCRNVLVSGASGLLGSAVVQRLARVTGVLPLAHAHPHAGMRCVDLTDPSALARLGDEPWDAVVHCAAYRSPDFCEQVREAAHVLNAVAPAQLAALAAARGARMIHISTDYVFPGTQAPYREDDPCAPVNYYGQTKLEAEQAVARQHPAAVILRIGALYADPAAGVPAPLLEEGLAAACAQQTVELDNRIVRYPVLNADVAEVIGFLLEGDYAGVLHAGAETPVTRYGWTRMIAGYLGRDTSHLRPTDRDLARPAPRPVDTGLAVERLRGLGGPLPRNCEQVLPAILARYGAAGHTAQS